MSRLPQTGQGPVSLGPRRVYSEMHQLLVTPTIVDHTILTLTFFSTAERWCGARGWWGHKLRGGAEGTWQLCHREGREDVLQACWGPHAAPDVCKGLCESSPHCKLSYGKPRTSVHLPKLDAGSKSILFHQTDLR